jgi:hypothetical protein
MTKTCVHTNASTKLIHPRQITHTPTHANNLDTAHTQLICARVLEDTAHINTHTHTLTHTHAHPHRHLHATLHTRTHTHTYTHTHNTHIFRILTNTHTHTHTHTHAWSHISTRRRRDKDTHAARAHFREVHSVASSIGFPVSAKMVIECRHLMQGKSRARQKRRKDWSRGKAEARQG